MRFLDQGRHLLLRAITTVVPYTHFPLQSNVKGSRRMRWNMPRSLLALGMNEFIPSFNEHLLTIDYMPDTEPALG